jgi:hypothetical protein
MLLPQLNSNKPNLKKDLLNVFQLLLSVKIWVELEKQLNLLIQLDVKVKLNNG